MRFGCGWSHQLPNHKIRGGCKGLWCRFGHGDAGAPHVIIFLPHFFIFLSYIMISYGILGCDSFGARLEHICSLFWRSICNGPCRPTCWKEVPKMATALFVMKSLDHIDHINYIVPSSMASFIIHDSSICTQLIWFSWSGWNEGSHMKFQWFCHCSKSGGHYIHVVSSDWASQRSGKQHCGNARDAVLEAQTCSSRNFNIIWTISFQWPYLKQQHPGSSFLHAKMHLPASMPGNGAIAS